jgi:hypothetical protein
MEPDEERHHDLTGDSLMDLITALNTLLPIAFLLTLSTFLVWFHEPQD